MVWPVQVLNSCNLKRFNMHHMAQRTLCGTICTAGMHFSAALEAMEPWEVTTKSSFSNQDIYFPYKCLNLTQGNFMWPEIRLGLQPHPSEAGAGWVRWSLSTAL